MRKLFTTIATLMLAMTPAMADEYKFRAPVTFTKAVTFASGSVISATSSIFTTPKIAGAGAGYAILQYGNSATSRTITFPDPGANDSVAYIGKAQTFAGIQTFTLAPVLTSGTFTTNGDTITIQDLGNANLVQSEGTQTINGAKTFSTAPTITGGLTAANIQTGSAKRELMTATLSPTTGAAVDTTVYRFTLAPGRAGIVKRVNIMCQLPPTVGTDTIKILKNGSAGNTMLSAASFDANTLTANTATNMTLTATSGDLTLVATDTIYCEYSAGTQTQDAIGVAAVVEFEPTDF
jgi:hypothetical protein